MLSHLGFAGFSDDDPSRKLGVESLTFDACVETIGETQGDLVIMIGNDLSPEAQAVGRQCRGRICVGRSTRACASAREVQQLGRCDRYDAGGAGSSTTSSRMRRRC